MTVDIVDVSSSIIVFILVYLWCDIRYMTGHHDIASSCASILNATTKLVTSMISVYKYKAAFHNNERPLSTV